MMKEGVAATATIPGDLSQTLTIAKYELLNHLRSKRFLLLLTLILVGSVAATGVVAYLRPASMLADPTTFLSSWVQFTIVFVVAVPASFLGGDAISSEFQNRTGYSMIGNPVKRSTILLGKTAAALAASLFFLVVYGMITFANTSYYFGATGAPPEFFASMALAGVAIAASLGLAFTFSSMIKNGAFSVLMSSFLLLYGFSLVENVFVRVTSYEPWFLFSYAFQIISTVFVSPFPEHVVRQGDRVMYFATVPEALAILIGYFVLGIAASLFIFQRRELA